MEEKNRDFWAMEQIGERLERWPKNSEGEPEEPVKLCWCEALDMAAQMRMSMLEAFGIPCICQYRGGGGFGKLMMGMSGEGMDLYVPKSMLEDAKALCEEEYHEEL